jgi:DNA modification methylase
MQIYMEKQTGRIIRVGCGDSAEMIPQNVEDNSVHAVVTDPPY